MDGANGLVVVHVAPPTGRLPGPEGAADSPAPQAQHADPNARSSQWPCKRSLHLHFSCGSGPPRSGVSPAPNVSVTADFSQVSAGVVSMWSTPSRVTGTR